ncbi:MAG: hypothetical protein JWM98_523 [Thermoleophilia bacterium]|nr:hypothetical protein [Thermoleophilia bacterium]
MAPRVTTPADGPDLPLVEHAFERASNLRGRRIFHPRGVAWQLDLRRVAPAERLPDIPLLRAARATGVARLSRGLGLPTWLPDAIGLAVRIDVDGAPAQDLLLVSSLDGPLLNRVIRPAWARPGLVLSSILPMEVEGRALWFGARLGAVATGGPGGGPAMEFELLVARRLDRFHTWATGRVTGTLPAAEAEALRFDPWRCTDGVRPAGLVNRTRPAAYLGSRRGRARA